MFNVYSKTVQWGGQELKLETGRVARQADGAVMATYGNTTVLATVCFAKQERPDMDFFPLTVNYQEKFYSAGRIPGGFFKREGRPTEKETLTSRLIDRPIRPLFTKGFKNETQVVTTVLSTDGENDADVVAMVAASAALAISGAPFMGPIGCARVGYINNEFVLNPTTAQREESALDMVVAGTDEGVLMVESEASELSEETMLQAVNLAHEEGKKAINAINELAKEAAKTAFEMPAQPDNSELETKLRDQFGTAITEAYKIQEKQARRTALDEVKTQALTAICGADEEARDAAEVKTVSSIVKGLEADVLRGDVLTTQKRIDGRGTADVRQIKAEVDVLPTVHGSALFTRGETQALVVTTLGTGSDEQIIDAPTGEFKDRFMLHYNFPPFSVGETGRMGSPGRREIGHGRLARRAIERMLPDAEEFPYTMRIVSEITESNGSSSMATVCGTSMALMASGVPMAKPVAGIAMGLVKENDDYVVLSDIMGDEDHLGDMDFKVAGTSDGITALQMDIKITSITSSIMQEALAQAKDGRLHILGKMAEAITEGRSGVSDTAPVMERIQIDKDKIRVVIGSGGKTIRELVETTGCTIDIDDEGIVTIAGVGEQKVENAIMTIERLLQDPEVGEMYEGTVTNIVDFGAFVKFLPQHEGLLHISELVPVRVGNTTDILEEGDTVQVKVVGFERGKVRLTMKDIPQDTPVAERVASVIEQGGTASSDDNNGGERKERKDRGDRKKSGGRGPRRAA